MGILTLLFTPLFSLGEYAYERWSPQTWWYEYEAIVPEPTSFRKGQTLTFNSKIEYKRNINMQWFDYVVCDDGDTIRKLDTQVWPESPEPKTPQIFGDPELQPDGSFKVPTWAYTEAKIPATSNFCLLVANPVGYTPRFNFPKVDEIITPWFPVNQ